MRPILVAKRVYRTLDILGVLPRVQKYSEILQTVMVQASGY